MPHRALIITSDPKLRQYIENPKPQNYFDPYRWYVALKWMLSMV